MWEFTTWECIELLLKFMGILTLLTLLHSLVQGCPSLRNPFDGETVLRTFSFVYLIHSNGYASAADRPTCFASLPQNSKSWGDMRPRLALII